MQIDFNFFQSTFFSHKLKLILVEIIDTHTIEFHIKVVFKFSISFTGQIELSEVISAIISEVKKRAWFHPVDNFFEHLKMLLRDDRR